MLSPSTLLLAFAATALAQTTSSGLIPTPTISSRTGTSFQPAATGISPTGGATTSDLPALINQVPKCAVKCLSSASTDIGCKGPSDFACLCTSSEKLAQTMGLCILGAGCSQDDISKVVSIAPQICAAYGQSQQNPAALASGTSAVSSLQSAAGVTSGAKGNAAAPARTGAPLAAVVGLGAWAVMAL